MTGFVYQWKALIAGAREKALATKALTLWPDHALWETTVARVSSHFDRGLEKVRQQLGFLYESGVHDVSQDFKILLLQWANSEYHEGPSLCAIGAHFIEHWKLDLQDDLVQVFVMAALLGEMDTGLAYHNVKHNRKVLCNMIALIMAHRSMDDVIGLSDAEIMLLLIAVSIHDVAHDGKGNVLQGSLIAGRLERQSWEVSYPYLQEAGLHSADWLQMLEAMVLCTDTFPIGEPESPVNQLKALYDSLVNEASNVGKRGAEVSYLLGKPKATLMAMLVHEADIASSAGVDYEISCQEAAMVAKESQAGVDVDTLLRSFVENILGGRPFYTKAGLAVYGDAFKLIEARLFPASM